MKQTKILIIIFHSTIIIAAGHGVGIMIFCDIMGMTSLFERATIQVSYDLNFLIVGAASLIGKIMMALSLLLNTARVKNTAAILGLIFLIAAFIIVLFAIADGSFAFNLTLLSGLPFLWYSYRLIYLLLKKNNG
ncbi:hypothetical protein GR160_12560 [Flavobacterium sp. Sd200]|uniref:hypothetical protein n=1 Tax=Flavobacterium sp. Sd200 TaxID=2692211 RepID=UPI001368E6CD|nr:hypothetical protein [Flavobacterium sp. Sd200]MXN92059.1 hypothetical protein [Flavobacterium sp. Sd200]